MQSNFIKMRFFNKEMADFTYLVEFTNCNFSTQPFTENSMTIFLRYILVYSAEKSGLLKLSKVIVLKNNSIRNVLKEISFQSN